VRTAHLTDTDATDNIELGWDLWYKQGHLW